VFVKFPDHADSFPSNPGMIARPVRHFIRDRSIAPPIPAAQSIPQC
jgi:hypothetical protein